MKHTKHRRLLAIVVLGLLVLLAGCQDNANGTTNQTESATAATRASAEPTSGGQARNSNAKSITTVDELQAISANLAGNYLLTSDIDASATAEWNDGAGFEPIGDKENPFTGSFDGDGHLISRLHIDAGDAEYVGLFGYTGSSSEITGVTIADGSVKGKFTVGALAGRNEGSISDSRSAAAVEGMLQVGGLVGTNYGRDTTGVITGSSSSGEVNGENNVGGLAGLNVVASIVNSFSSGPVYGNREVGGLVGYLNGGTVTASYSTGDVTGTHFNIGGLVGVSQGEIMTSYSLGEVSGSTSVGGLVGRDDSFIKNSYSAGSVTGDEDVGGLVGEKKDGDDPAASHWEADEAGSTQPDSGLGASRSTADMMQQATFDGWDFPAVWMIDEGEDYPDLSDNPRIAAD